MIDKKNLIYFELISLIREKYWEPKGGFTRDTKILSDLKIDGDDAVDLITLISDKFEVDFSSFIPAKYFNAEGFDPIGLSYLFNKLIGKDKLREAKLKYDITIGDLERAILDKKWVDPEV